MTPLPLAVIGGGLIGLRHAQVAQASASVALQAVVEPDPARRAELAGMGLPVAPDIDAVAETTRACVIATPTATHADLAARAMARGWAVLVEKPIAHTVAEAEALCATAEAAGLPLITGHHRRCHPFVTRAQELMQHIGALVLVQGIWAMRKHASYFDTAWRHTSAGGVVLINLIHDIDMLRHLAGDIAEVTALTSQVQRGLSVEDTAALSLRFASGALGSFALSDAGASPWSFEAATGENPGLAHSGQDCLRFIGTTGALSFPSLELWRDAPGAEPDWRKPLYRTDAPTLSRIDPLAEQLDRFAALVRDDRDTHLATGRDGTASLAATLAVLWAADTGQPVRPQDVPGHFTGLNTREFGGESHEET